MFTPATTARPVADVPEFSVSHWRYLHGPPVGHARVRACPEDFQVEEQLGFTPPGSGAHHWIYLRYHSLNTADVARMIARAAGIPPKDVGYGGLKDRVALTSQWFSLPRQPADSGIHEGIVSLSDRDERLELLRVSANTRKLRRGVHSGNGFRITLRKVNASGTALEARLKSIRARGVPNYFGPQRFGRNGNNLRTAVRMFRGESRRVDRMTRSMALSAARAWVFNEVLSQRIGRQSWDQPMAWDCMQLDGSRSRFIHDGSDPDVAGRVGQGDIHLTGPLWGRGWTLATGPAAAFEEKAVAGIDVLPGGLAAAGLKQDRRALRVFPAGLDWQCVEPDKMVLEFFLPQGAYATAVLRELLHTG